MRIDKATNTYCYDSVGEFTKWLEETPQTELGALYDSSRNKSAKDTRRKGTKTFEDANRLLEKGDSDLVKKIEAQAKDIKLNPRLADAKSIDVHNSPQGFIPNVGAYMTGHPNNMINVRQTFKPRSKVLTVIVNPCVHHKIDKEKVLEYGAKVACAIEILEKKGYRLNLHVCNNIVSDRSKNCERYNLYIKIKDAGKPLDILRAAYPLAHPSMQRRHIFAFAERCNWTLPAHYGYGVIQAQSERERLFGKHIYLSVLYAIYRNQSLQDICKEIEKAAG